RAMVRTVLVCLCLSSGTARAADYYVSTTGTAGGSGSIANPWNLQTALSQPAAVHPGDTIWLRGGTYSAGSLGLLSSLTGSAASPIVVRSYPGEWAKIDGAAVANGQDPMLTVQGAFTTYRDFEVMSSSNPTPDGGQFARSEGLQIV